MLSRPTKGIVAGMICGGFALGLSLAPDLSPADASQDETAAPKQASVMIGRRARKREWRPPSVAGSTAGQSAASALSTLLVRLSRSMTRPRKAAVLEALRARIDEFEEPLLKILEDEAHPVVVTALEVVGALRIQVAAPHLSALARSERHDVRVAAIRAGCQLDVFDHTELDTFLVHDEAAVVIAAIEASARTRGLTAELIPYLANEDAAIRAAVVQAWSPTATAEEVHALRAFAGAAQGAQTRVEVAAALGRAGASTEAEGGLVAMLEDSSLAVRRAALDALGNERAPGTVPTDHPDPVATRLLSVVADPVRSLREKMPALFAIERRGRIPVAELKVLLPSLHPMMQVLAARCLVTAGDREGVALAVELIETTDDTEVRDAEAEFTVAEARGLLIELADGEALDSQGEWEAWLATLPDVEPRVLTRRVQRFW